MRGLPKFAYAFARLRFCVYGRIAYKLSGNRAYAKQLPYTNCKRSKLSHIVKFAEISGYTLRTAHSIWRKNSNER